MEEVAWRRKRWWWGDADDEAKSKPVSSFTEALNAFETMTAFM